MLIKKLFFFNDIIKIITTVGNNYFGNEAKNFNTKMLFYIQKKKSEIQV